MRKLIPALLVASVLLGVFAVSVDAQSTWQRFNNVWANSLKTTGDLTAGDDLIATDDLAVADDAVITDDLSAADLAVSGGSNLTGNVDVTGNLEVVDHIANSGQEYYITGAAVTVTDGGTITPSEALVELTAAGTVGASVATCVDGQWVMFVNTAAQTITITDTGSVRLAGDWAGAQTDTLTLACIGVLWYEMARANN
jgi:hypothetical protein